MVEKNKFAETDLKLKSEQGTVVTEERDINEPLLKEVVVEDKTESTFNQDYAALEMRYQQLNDQYTRLAADFENYRKRMADEHESLVKYGATKSVMQLLPVLDNLERATLSLNENSDPKILFKSFDMMYKQILEGFSSLGVQKIEVLGQPFDPQYHEAVNQITSADFPENTVAAELQSGYILNDKVLRPAMVAVSSGPPDTEKAGEDSNPFKK